MKNQKDIITEIQTADGHKGVITKKVKYTLTVPEQYRIAVYDQQSEARLYRHIVAKEEDALKIVREWTKEKYCAAASKF